MLQEASATLPYLSSSHLPTPISTHFICQEMIERSQTNAKSSSGRQKMLDRLEQNEDAEENYGLDDGDDDEPVHFYFPECGVCKCLFLHFPLLSRM